MSGNELTEEGVVDTGAFGDLPGVKQFRGMNDAVSQDNVDLGAVQSEIGSLASEAMSAVTNPISWLVEQGLSFLMEFVKPLEEMIQLVSGDKESLTASSEQFAEVQQKLNDLAQELVETVDGGLREWDGKAADSFRRKMAEFADGVENTGKQAHNLSELLQMSATLAEAAEGVIKGILADLISWLIMTWIPALASAGPTFGGSTAAASAATAAETGVATANAASKVQRIISILEKVMTAIDAIKAVLDTIRVVDAMSDIQSGNSNDGKNAERSKALEDTKGAAEDVKGAAEDYQASLEGDESADGSEQSSAEDGTSTEADTSSDADASTGAETSDADASTSTDTSSEAGTSSDTSGADTTNSIDPKQTAADGATSVLGHYGDNVSSAADSLEEQANNGGFSDVPPDQQISGQLSG